MTGRITGLYEIPRTIALPSIRPLQARIPIEPAIASPARKARISRSPSEAMSIRFLVPNLSYCPLSPSKSSSTPNIALSSLLFHDPKQCHSIPLQNPYITSSHPPIPSLLQISQSNRTHPNQPPFVCSSFPGESSRDLTPQQQVAGLLTTQQPWAPPPPPPAPLPRSSSASSSPWR